MPSHLKTAVSNQDHIQGAEEASIEIVEYGDYQCPSCVAAYPVIQKIQKKFMTQIRFVFRNFPLSESHPFAMPAAIAAEAAGLQGKYWEMHDLIFENQNALSDENLLSIATSAGLNIAQFKNDVQRPDLQEKVESDFETGIRSGVNGTPTFFVNGTRFDGGAEDLYDMLLESTEE